MRPDDKNRRKMPKYLDISTGLRNFITNIIFSMTNQLKNIVNLCSLFDTLLVPCSSIKKDNESRKNNYSYLSENGFG